jgi:sporulation protein YlmC with PRC-barrel domain
MDQFLGHIEKEEVLAMRVHVLATIFSALGLFGLLLSPASAIEPAANNRAANEQVRVDKKTDVNTARVSQVRGMTVRNSAGKDLGEIKDLMLDMGERGHIRYAALSFGGFLGMGDKLFAIPWRALKFQHDADKNKDFVVFDVSEDKLKNMSGFDKNHWPDMADRSWMEATDRHHGIDIRAGNTEVHVRTDAPNDRAVVRNSDRNWRLHRASEAVGMQVRNGSSEKLGKVEDIVIGTTAGDIRYLALSFGGFLGIGDKYFAVPWDAVAVQYDADGKDFFVVFDATKEQLKNAPGFDKDHWPNFGDEQWAKQIQEHYQGHRREAKATSATRVK